MIKKAQLKIVMIMLLSVALNLSSQSQTRKYFIINGKVISELNSSGNSSVQIIKNNQKSISSQIPGNGMFRLELEYNAEYQLVFTKKGNQSKAIIVNTEIPENAIKNSTNFPHFLMTIKLLDESQDSEKKYSGNQIQHICYSQQNDCFTTLSPIFNVEYVEKGNSDQNQKMQSQEYKAKL
jgi:hypothetical protein